MPLISIDKLAFISNHIGTAQNPRSLFFAEPPTDLGEILSAQSNYMKGDNSKYCFKRIAIFFISLLCAIWIGYLFIDNDIYAFELGIYYYLWVTTWIGLGAFIAYKCTRFKRSCSYVGEKGFVEYTLNSQGRIKERRLYFSDHIKLYKNIFRVYKSYSALERIYQKTKYIYQWEGDGKKDSFTIKGSYFSFYEQLDEMGYYAQLAIAVKNAWNRYIGLKMLLQFSSEQPISVDIRGGYWLSFCRGKLFLSGRALNSSWELKDIEKVKFGHGMLQIYRKKFNNYTQLFNPFDRRVRTIRYCDIPNADQIIKLIHLIFPNSSSLN